LVQKQQNIFGRISLFWNVVLQGLPMQQNGGDHDWLIQTSVSTVQLGMLLQLSTSARKRYQTIKRLEDDNATIFYQID